VLCVHTYAGPPLEFPRSAFSLLSGKQLILVRASSRSHDKSPTCRQCHRHSHWDRVLHQIWSNVRPDRTYVYVNGCN